MSSQADSFTLATRQNYEGMQVQLSIVADSLLNDFGASTFEIRVYKSSAPNEFLFYEDKRALSTKEELVNISSGFTYANATSYTVKVSALDSNNADVSGNDEVGTLEFTYYDPPADFTATITSEAAQLIVSVSGVPVVEPHITAFRLFGYNQTDISDSFTTTIARTDYSSSSQTLIGSGDANPNNNLWVDGETWIVNIIGHTANGNTYGTTNDVSASGVIQAAPNDPSLNVTTPLLANVTNGPQFSLVIVDETPIIENSVSAWTKSSVDISQNGTTVTVVTDISNTGTNAGTADSSANSATYSVSSDIGTLTLTLGPIITGSNGTLTLDASNPVTIAVKNSNTISGTVNIMNTAESTFTLVDGNGVAANQGSQTSFTPENDNIPTLTGEPDVVQPLNVPASVVQFSYAGVTTAMPKVVGANEASEFVQPHTWTIQASVGGSTGTYEIDLSGNPPSEYSFNGTTGVGTLSAITLAASDFGLNDFAADDVLALSSFLTIELDSGFDLSGTVVETVDLSGVYRNVDDVSGSVSSITLEYPFTPNAPTLTVTNPASNPISDSSAQFIIKIEDGTPILDQSNNPVDISAVTLTITQGTNSATLSLDVTNFDSSASYTLGPDICGNDAASFTLATDTDVSLSCTITNSVAPTASAATTTFTLNGDASQNVFGPEFNPSFTSMVTDGSLSAALTDSDTISKNTITVNLSSGFPSPLSLSNLYNSNGVSDINLTISALDTSGNTVLDSSGVTDLSENILLDVSQNSDPTQIILKLTASGADNASNQWTDISLITSALTLIDTQLGISSLTAHQPAKSGTTLDCSMVIGDTSGNISNYSSATATLYVNKNNLPAKPLDLSTSTLASTIKVASVPASDVSGSDTAKTFSFDLSGVAQYLRGHALYVSATMTSAGSANSFTTGATDTSNALVYLYTSPSITYAASGISADISSNGYTVSSVFGVDNTTDGEVGLDMVFFDSETNQTGDVSFNNQYNYVFGNNGDDNTIAYENTQINGITTTNTNLLVHMTTNIASNKDEMQIKGSAALNLTN